MLFRSLYYVRHLGRLPRLHAAIVVAILALGAIAVVVALASWAAEQRPGMRIIIVTGLSEQLGALRLPWQVLRKPYRAQALLGALQGAG